MDKTRLVVVSNRLSIVLKKEEHQDWQIKPSSGGLVTALGPVLRNRGGLWIGWLGVSAKEPLDKTALQDLLDKGAVATGYTLIPVDLTQDEIRKYYFGFSNEILWPLFHDLSSRCNFDPAYWEVYRQVNRKFAETIASHTSAEDFVWVHDYQLITVAHELKKMGTERHTGFFLHIPFPPLDVFLKMPWRFQVLEALLDYDLVGFQTVRDRRNFLDCVRTMVREAKVVGHGQVCCELRLRRQRVLAGVFPISIDFREFAKLAASRQVADQAATIHANLRQERLILGVDRLDYTKGIPRRLMAFANALERYPQMRGKVSLIQVVVPSRQDINHYEEFKQKIERLVGEINGQYSQLGWTPIHYVFRSLTRADLVAYYRACDIALVTPLKDGMNLVAKEYCASSVDNNGVLILSEFAGAAAQLHRGAILVNPYDIERVADAIHQAFSMDSDERQARMKRLRRSIKQHDIFRWVNSFLKAAISKDLSEFPPMELFVPRRAPDETQERSAERMIV